TLRDLCREAEENQDHCRALHFASKLAEALFAADELAEADHVFREVLRQGAGAGIYQSILDGGPDVGMLLLRFQKSTLHTGAADDLLPYVETLIGGCVG